MKNVIDLGNVAVSQGFDPDINTISRLEGPTDFILGANEPLRPGFLQVANEERFIEANFSEPLTTYAVGYRDSENMEALLEFVCPKVLVGRRFEYVVYSNIEEFLSDAASVSTVNDVRAIGAPFKRIEYTSSKSTGSTLNKGLTIRVDLDNMDGLPNWRQIYTAKIIRRLLRNELYRAVLLLSAAATSTSVTWSQVTNQDPDADLINAMTNFGNGMGMVPNRAMYGLQAWNQRAFTFRKLLTAGSLASAGMDEEELAGLVGLQDVMVNKARYQSSFVTTSLKSFILGETVLVYMAEANQTPEDASNIKRFVSPTIGGQPMRVYEQVVNSKLVDITVEHYSNIVVTSTLGIQKLAVS